MPIDPTQICPGFTTVLANQGTVVASRGLIPHNHTPDGKFAYATEFNGRLQVNFPNGAIAGTVKMAYVNSTNAPITYKCALSPDVPTLEVPNPSTTYIGHWDHPAGPTSKVIQPGKDAFAYVTLPGNANFAAGSDYYALTKIVTAAVGNAVPVSMSNMRRESTVGVNDLITWWPVPPGDTGAGYPGSHDFTAGDGSFYFYVFYDLLNLGPLAILGVPLINQTTHTAGIVFGDSREEVRAPWGGLSQALSLHSGQSTGGGPMAFICANSNGSALAGPATMVDGAHPQKLRTDIAAQVGVTSDDLVFDYLGMAYAGLLCNTVMTVRGVNDIRSKASTVDENYLPAWRTVINFFNFSSGVRQKPNVYIGTFPGTASSDDGFVDPAHQIQPPGVGSESSYPFYTDWGLVRRLNNWILNVGSQTESLPFIPFNFASYYVINGNPNDSSNNFNRWKADSSGHPGCAVENNNTAIHPSVALCDSIAAALDKSVLVGPTVVPQLPPPIPSLMSGSSNVVGTSLTVSQPVSGSAIYYTLSTSGTPADPTTGSTLYSGTIPLNTVGTTVVKFFSTKAGFGDSAVGAATYTVTAIPATVTGIVVSPNPVTGSRTVTAAVSGTNSPSQVVVWSTNIGSINSSTGAFIAPTPNTTTQRGTITATSTVSGYTTVTGTAAVTIAPAVVPSAGPPPPDGGYTGSDAFRTVIEAAITTYASTGLVGELIAGAFGNVHSDGSGTYTVYAKDNTTVLAIVTAFANPDGSLTVTNVSHQ